MKTGSCMLTTVSGAATQTMSAYTSWKSSFLVSGNPGACACSARGTATTPFPEGIGYGMLAAVYMNDQATFDGLLAYQQAHLDSKGLMNWHIGSERRDRLRRRLLGLGRRRGHRLRDAHGLRPVVRRPTT